MPKEISKTEAIKSLIWEARSEKLTKVGLKRIRQACKALGLTEDEVVTVEGMFEYRDGNGSLYSHFA